MANYLPGKDGLLGSWTLNVAQVLTATPTVYGTNAAGATAYTATQSAYATALEAATDPSTRGKATIIAKNTKKKTLVSATRAIVRTIYGVAGISPEQLNAVGLTPRDIEPTPVPVPGFAPGASVKLVLGSRVTVKLQDTQIPTRRSKPAGVASASVMTWVGENPPADISRWTWQGLVTRTTFNIDFPLSVEPFSKVYITVMWANAKGQTGPASTPISTNLGSWLVQQAA